MRIVYRPKFTGTFDKRRLEPWSECRLYNCISTTVSEHDRAKTVVSCRSWLLFMPVSVLIILHAITPSLSPNNAVLPSAAKPNAP